MGIVWEAYHEGVPCPWGLLESSFHLKTDMAWQWELDGLQPNSKNL